MFLIHWIDPEKVIVPAVLISKVLLNAEVDVPLTVPDPFIVSVAVPFNAPPVLLLVKLPPTNSLRPTPLNVGIEIGMLKFPLKVISDASVDVVAPTVDVVPF
jgi:hypothetical protein